MTIIENAYHTLTVLEPKAQGTCKGGHQPAPLVTVKENISNHKPRCHLAANAGFFNRKKRNCYGNVTGCCTCVYYYYYVLLLNHVTHAHVGLSDCCSYSCTVV